MKNHTYSIYYYEEGDFLELTFDIAPVECDTEQIDDDVFVRRSRRNKKIVGVGIHNFRRRGKSVNELLASCGLELPFDIIVPVRLRQRRARKSSARESD